MSVRTFVDTNVLVYSIDDGEPAKRRIAERVLASRNYGEFVLSAQVLGEFYVTVTRKLAKPVAFADRGSQRRPGDQLGTGGESVRIASTPALSPQPSRGGATLCSRGGLPHR